MLKHVIGIQHNAFLHQVRMSAISRVNLAVETGQSYQNVSNGPPLTNKHVSASENPDSDPNVITLVPYRSYDDLTR